MCFEQRAVVQLLLFLLLYIVQYQVYKYEKRIFFFKNTLNSEEW